MFAKKYCIVQKIRTSCDGCSKLIEPWFIGKTYTAFKCTGCGFHKSGTIDEFLKKN